MFNGRQLRRIKMFNGRQLRRMAERRSKMNKTSFSTIQQLLAWTIMRIFLAALVVIIGANIGLSAINYVSDLQDAKMQKLCKIDSSYCKD